MSVSSFIQDQPRAAKGIEGVIIVGGVFLLGYAIYRAYQKGQDEKQANQPAEAATTELQQLAAKGIYPTWNDAQYLNLSEQLVQAMNGCGTDEDAIYQVFSGLRNDADFLKLVQQFGIRYYEPCSWSSPISYLRWQFNDKAFGGNLSTWLGYDLTVGEIAHINSILSSHSITYSF